VRLKYIHMFDMLCIIIDIMLQKIKYKIKVCRLILFLLINKLIKQIYHLEDILTKNTLAKPLNLIVAIWIRSMV